METQTCQNLIIGSGAAGKIVSWKLGKMGQKTIVVERSLIGGACPNVACLPSKNVVHSAKAVSLVDPKRGLGVVTGSMKVDMPAVIRRKRQMVEGLIKIHLDNFAASGVEIVMGEARFIEPKTVEVKLNAGGTQRLTGERVFIDVGTRASIPSTPGLAAAAPMTHIELLNLERLPDHLVIIGGGYVGLEFAQAMRRFGSQVTIIQHGRLLPEEDPDMSDAIMELMKNEGVDVLLEAEMLNVAPDDPEPAFNFKCASENHERAISASDILVAAGRTPNTDRLDAAKGNVRLDSHGYIQVNERLQTSAPDVWAMGECAGSPKFTHVAEDDCAIVLDNLSGGKRTTRDQLIPYCLFTDPELAHVGLHESQAKAKGISYRLVKFPMAGVLRTHTLSEKRGFCKALIGKDDRILGFTAFGAEASEMMGIVQTAMFGGMPYTALRDIVYAHPTMAEGVKSLFSIPT